MRSALPVAVCAVAWRAFGAAEAAPPEPLREVVRKAMGGLQREGETRERFLYKVRSERKDLNPSSGKVASWEARVWERVEIDGVTFGRTLERDGKPVSAKERKDEDAAIQRRLATLKAPKPATAAVAAQPDAARLSPPRATPQDEWYLEFPEALDYKLAGEESIDGRAALRLDALPRASYQPKNLRARIFEKLKASLWIDKATSELVKADAEMFDTVSLGFGVLGKVEKGTRFQMRRRLHDGAWLIESQSIRFGARILLFKTMHTESSTEWTEFRRRPSLASGGPPATAPKSRP